MRMLYWADRLPFSASSRLPGERKVHANASRQSALSYGPAQRIEAKPQAEVQEMLARTAAADQEPLPKGMSIPMQLARREERLAGICKAQAQIEARAAERDALAQAEFEAKKFNKPPSG